MARTIANGVRRALDAFVPRNAPRRQIEVAGTLTLRPVTPYRPNLFDLPTGIHLILVNILHYTKTWHMNLMNIEWDDQSNILLSTNQIFYIRAREAIKYSSGEPMKSDFSYLSGVEIVWTNENAHKQAREGTVQSHLYTQRGDGVILVYKQNRYHTTLVFKQYVL